MYIAKMKFKREENSEYEKGYYIGEHENTKKSCYLDSDFKPLDRDEKGYQVWDSHLDIDDLMEIRL